MIKKPSATPMPALNTLSFIDRPFAPPPDKPRKKKRRRIEDGIQEAVFKHINTRGVPDLVAFAVPNGGYRLKSEGARLKRTGVRAGAPDIVLFHQFRAYALELKAPGNQPTDEQEACLIALRAAGVSATHAHGLDEAVRILEMWGLLLGKSQ